MPLHLDPPRLLSAVAILVIAFTVRGITGFGSGLIAIPLLALMFPLTLVIPTMVLLDYIGSLHHGFRYRGCIAWTEIPPLLPSMLLGVSVALYLLDALEAQRLTRALGVFVLLFALYSWLHPVPKRRAVRGWAVPGGLFGGLVGTLFGTGGPFYVAYLQARGLDKGAFRATISMLFVLDGAIRLGGFVIAGFYSTATLILVAGALPIMFLAMAIGARMHTGISDLAFRRGIALLLLGSGSALLLK